MTINDRDFARRKWTEMNAKVVSPYSNVIGSQWKAFYENKAMQQMFVLISITVTDTTCVMTTYSHDVCALISKHGYTCVFFDSLRDADTADAIRPVLIRSLTHKHIRTHTPPASWSKQPQSSQIVQWWKDRTSFRLFWSKGPSHVEPTTKRRSVCAGSVELPDAVGRGTRSH